MPLYSVAIPVAGHAYVTVEAENEEAAIDAAMEKEITLKDVEEWETLRQFNRGNLCYCPLPWEVEATEQ